MNDEHDNLHNHANRAGREGPLGSGDAVRREADASARGAQPGAQPSGASDDGLPPLAGAELADLVRDLDRIGAMRRRELSSSLEERIFAASDLQLPLAHADIDPVLARIEPRGRFIARHWLRIAAGIAVVASITAGAVVLSRGVGSSGDGDRAAPGTGRAIAEANGSSGSSTSAPGTAAPAAEHFELALAAATPQRASSMSSTVVASALDAPRRLAYVPANRAQAGAPEAIALGAGSGGSGTASAASASRAFGGAVGEFDGAFGGFSALAGGGSDQLQDAIDLDFEGLSGEFAAIVSRSAGAN